jgi:hypothetical protein
MADRVAACLPDERIEIEIDVMGQTRRRFMIRAIGERVHPVVSRIVAARH